MVRATAIAPEPIASFRAVCMWSAVKLVLTRFGGHHFVGGTPGRPSGIEADVVPGRPMEALSRPCERSTACATVSNNDEPDDPCAARISLSRVEVRDLRQPEAVITYPLGVSNQVRLAGTVVTRHLLQPGWSWEKHAQPVVGTASCELYHRGVVLSGRMGIRTDEGDEVVIEPNQVFDLPPGHVTWVEGDEELVMVDWAGGAGFDAQPGEGGRVMATILFTDVVDSTALAQRAGDAAWKRTVAMHDDIVRTVIAGFGGREIETAGDSFLIVFDGAERAIRGAFALVDALAAIRIPIRVGIHSGEVETATETTSEAWRSTLRPGFWPLQALARSSYRGSPAIWRRDLSASASTPEGDIASRASIGISSCSP